MAPGPFLFGGHRVAGNASAMPALALSCPYKSAASHIPPFARLRGLRAAVRQFCCAKQRVAVSPPAESRLSNLACRGPFPTQVSQMTKTKRGHYVY